jgi:hypothetical protein
LLLPALAAVWLAAACGGDDDESTGDATPADGTAVATEADVEATLAITAPEDGAALESGDIEVALEVGGFDVVDKLGQAPVAGEGHVHYYINVAQIPTAPGQPAVTGDETTYHAEATTTYTWAGMRPGTHKFGVQLVNNDHTPLEPAVTDEVTVTVQ